MQIKKSVVFLLPSLGGGGSERVFLNICKYLDKSKFNVTLCLLKREGDFLFYIENENDLKIDDLDVSRVRYSIFPIIKYLRKAKPDVVISTLGHLNAILSSISFLIPSKIKIIGRESNIISLSGHHKFTLLLYQHFYKNFDKIVVQSTDMEIDLKKTVTNLTEKQIVKINNPVDTKSIQNACIVNHNVLPKNKINLISVGSLTAQKGFDILLKSFSKFNKRENYHLTILGKGKLENDLKALTKKLGISNDVTFIGFKDNPYPYFSQASIFISSSRFEGFPNVVLEALACDVPVIANNYTGGINEIIDNPLFGKVIDLKNSVIFESSCEAIINKEVLPNTISKEIEMRYGIYTIVSKYEALIQNI